MSYDMLGDQEMVAFNTIKVHIDALSNLVGSMRMAVPQAVEFIMGLNVGELHKGSRWHTALSKHLKQLKKDSPWYNPLNISKPLEDVDVHYGYKVATLKGLLSDHVLCREVMGVDDSVSIACLSFFRDLCASYCETVKYVQTPVQTFMTMDGSVFISAFDVCQPLEIDDIWGINDKRVTINTLHIDGFDYIKSMMCLKSLKVNGRVSEDALSAIYKSNRKLLFELAFNN